MNDEYMKAKYKELSAQVEILSEQLREERRLSFARKNRVPGGYYMMSRAAEKNIRALARDNPTAFLVFSVIRENMQIGTNAVTISNAAFAKILNVSPRTIIRSTKYLKEKKYIQIVKIGNANAYVVNERIAFAGTPGQRTAVFTSTNIGHECENENWDDVEKLKAVPIIKIGERPIIGDDELPPPDQLDLNIE